MKSFRFRLERVLRWRGIELAMQEAMLKRLLDEEMRLRSTLAAIQSEKLQLSLNTAALPDASGHDLNFIGGYASRLARQRDRALQQQREKQREITAQMQAHRAAKQRHQLLEELRERRLDEWQRDSDREIEELAQESYLSRWRSLTRSAAPPSDPLASHAALE